MKKITEAQKTEILKAIFKRTNIYYEKKIVGKDFSDAEELLESLNNV
ncbi:MAG: hypothetical protein AAB373_01570 [Patescibacteria group bacterium]